MKIKSRFLLSSLVIVSIALYLIFSEFTKNLKPQFRKTTEESLIDTSRLLAQIASITADGSQLNIEIFKTAMEQQNKEVFHAELFDTIKSNSDLRLYITDDKGLVLLDSNDGLDVGKDYSTWRDIKLTLEGKYGARTSHDEQNRSYMYVSAPIMKDNKILGVLTLVKPTIRINAFVATAEKKILFICIIAGLIIMLTFSTISLAITKPIDNLINYARGISSGKRPLLPNLGNSEIKELGQAFIEMKNALEGKNYIENYVQTLTHEIKAPVSAIKGAAELLEEEIPQHERIKFTNNIIQQNERIESLVNNLLFLSKIENKLNLDDLKEIEVFQIYNEIVLSYEPLAKQKNVKLDFQGNKHTRIEGDPFLLKIALSNIIKNALEFSPDNSEIITTISRAEEAVILKIKDSGPGIPEYALEKIFDRFYSLPRPNGGSKSSGLGLTFVKEILNLHGATISLTNMTPHGLTAEIKFIKTLSS